MSEDEEDLPPTQPLEWSDEDHQPEEEKKSEEEEEKKSEEEEGVENSRKKQKIANSLEARTPVVDLSTSTNGVQEEEEREEESVRTRRNRAIRVLGQFSYDWKEHENYSGRDMYGRVSDFAVVLPHHPRSKLGAQLATLGMAYDNMAFDWIYYYM